MAIDEYDFCAAVDHTRVMLVFGVIAMIVVIFLMWNVLDNTQKGAAHFAHCVEVVNISGMCDYESIETALIWGFGKCSLLRNVTGNDTIAIPPESLWRP